MKEVLAMRNNSDELIIQLYQSRSEIAISETKNKYGKLIFSVANGVLQNNADAEECENDTYVGLWNSIPPEHPSNLRAYCAKIARYCALKKLEYYFAEKRDRRKSISYESLLEELGELATVKEEVEETQLSEELNIFMAKLKERDRKIFVLRYWYMLSVNEVAAECHVSENLVKTILFRTRRKLKDWLNERGYY